jgi:hypothetical protein
VRIRNAKRARATNVDSLNLANYGRLRKVPDLRLHASTKLDKCVSTGRIETRPRRAGPARYHPSRTPRTARRLDGSVYFAMSKLR